MQELEEYQTELINKWEELHKKSMVTLLILFALTESPMWSKELEQWLKKTSGWELNERSLHRTLKRMAKLGLIQYKEVDAPKTGASRKVYMISESGISFLNQIKSSSLSYLDSPFLLER